MDDQNQDKLIRLYFRLNAIKANLPKDGSVEEAFVKDYHLIIEKLVGLTDLDLDEFTIPISEVKPYLIMASSSGKKVYSKKSFCNGSLFFSKLDALMSYLQIKYLSKNDTKIGFTAKE